MTKSKRDPVTADMRARLSTNREGKLTSTQWKEIVTEPIATLLLLLVPTIIFLRARIFYFVAGGGWLIGVAAVVILIGVILMRAGRYARAPIHTGTFRAAEQFRPFWMFWKAEIFFDEAGRTVRFNKRLAPASPHKTDEQYLIYYLKDGDGQILLSIAPASHPDAAGWQPSPAFQARLALRQRSQR
ncbi:MAG: hypothetical protein ABI690_12050 [Chloroflexota bacterium]